MNLPWGLTRADAHVGALVLALALVRAATLGMSGFGFYHGSNEGNYANVAAGYAEDPWAPHAAQGLFYNTPPLASYAIGMSFAVFGHGEAAARLPSLAAYLVGALGVFFAARKLHGPAPARYATLLFATMPWTVLWFGRAQTDPYLTGLLALALALFLHGQDRRWTLPAAGVTLGLAGLAKQTALLLVVALAVWIWRNGSAIADRRRFAGRSLLWAVVGGLPVVAYYALQLQNHPDEVLAAFGAEATGRTDAFANVPRNLLHGLAVGATPIVLLLAAAGFAADTQRWSRPTTWWLALLGLFVMARTPSVHEYWTLVLLPPVAIYGGLGVAVVAKRLAERIHRPARATAHATMGVAATLNLVLAGALLGMAGDLGDQTVPVAARLAALEAEARPGTAFHFPRYYLDPLAWYEPDLMVSGAVGLRPYDEPPDLAALAAQDGEDILALQSYGAPTPPEGWRLLGGTQYAFLATRQGLWVLATGPAP